MVSGQLLQVEAQDAGQRLGGRVEVFEAIAGAGDRRAGDDLAGADREDACLDDEIAIDLGDRAHDEVVGLGEAADDAPGIGAAAGLLVEVVQAFAINDAHVWGVDQRCGDPFGHGGGDIGV